MTRRSLVTFIALGSAILAIAAVPKKTARPDLSDISPAFEVRVEVAPSSKDPYQLLDRQTPESFTCQATISVPDTHYLYAAQKVIVAPGGQKETSQTVKGMKFSFSAAVNDQATRADTVVTISRGGETLAKHRSTSMLPRPQRAVRPVQ